MPLPTVPGASAPFRLTSSPVEAFAHPSWERAAHEALAAVARGDRVLLMGAPGTGKTLLLHDLERTLRARGANVRVLRHGEPIGAVQGTDVLLIDEAGVFSAEELHRICSLPNAVVMAGLQCLQQRIGRSAGPIGTVTLEPLSAEDVARFVVARLSACGRPPDLFMPEALAALARRSGGLLRLVIILAGAALFFAELRGAGRVAADDVEEAAAMRAAVAEEVDAEAPPPAAPHPAASLPETSLLEASLSEALHTEPSWLPPVMPSDRTRFWPMAGVVVGLAGVTCAALAVAALAIAAALAVGPTPAIPLQALKSGSPPVLASAALPALLEPPPPPASARPPIALVSAARPVQLAAAPPPAPHPAPRPALRPAPAPASVPALAPGLAPASAPEPALAQAAVPAARLAPPAQHPAAPPDAAERPEVVLAFSGPIVNDTMGQGGRLSLQLRTDGSEGPVGAWFHASHGLIGTGTLRGKIEPDGRITLSGRLMMGHNPFDCALQATLDGDRLVGEATFVRASSGARAHSRFTLRRL